MDSYTRTMSAIYGEKYDRTPVIPHIVQHSMHIAGVPHSIFSTDSASMAWPQIITARKYKYDGFTIATDNQVISEAFGCRIIFPFDEPPQYESRILGNSRDLSLLKEANPLKKRGIPTFLHICGDTRHIIDLMPDSGADVLEIDSKISLDTAFESTLRNIRLQGNVDPVGIILQGTYDAVYEESIRCIKDSNGKYLILGSGCEVPKFTPEKNIEAMVAAANAIAY